MTTVVPERPLRALVLAPRGRDAAVAASLVEQAGVTTGTCPDLAVLVETLDDDTAFVLMTEDAIINADLKPLATWLAHQPAWSDLPLVLVTDGGGPERNPIAARWLEALGNVSFIERPFHPTTLVSLVRAMVKGRRRQLETRSLLADLRRGEVRLQQINDDLERRVDDRTAQLQHAHDELLAHVAERARTEEQLRQLQKLESIGQLTGGVAHDFNNLLTAVLGNLELLRKRLPSNPATDRLLDGATQGAQRGAALTQRLLAFARRQALQPKPTDLAELVRGMGDLLRRSLGPSIAIELDLPAGLPPALADQNQIELALLNLAVNARDAMPDGGRLEIALGLETVPPSSDLAAGKYVRLRVWDTGCGMDLQTLSRAIEPFFSTKEVGKGTGLGLSMIHGLALQLKGALRLDSEQGRGTRAELWLPVANGKAAAAVVDAEIGADTSKRRLNLLLVDDDFLISLSTAALLEDLGHEVVKASSGAAALEVLQSGKPVDLLITDYAMPGMTGVQLAEAARQLRPGLPILLATGYADLPARTKLDLPRLSKPYQQRQLAERITSLVG
ncbi:His Kinase A (phospho-acceptor) domain-containing protein [Rhodospirillales bacterium URHD0017]|nr:His Kinase A (phospho-acceptor) domain-containing protein [Rhodospirillales bacterium URHD0017]